MSEDPFGAFGIPLPPELLESFRKHNDRAHMTAEAMVTRVDTFLSGLDVDGLLALRTMFNTGDLNRSVMANFFDGQLVAILRYVHHVDPETGEKNPLG